METTAVSRVYSAGDNGLKSRDNLTGHYRGVHTTHQVGHARMVGGTLTVSLKRSRAGHLGTGSAGNGAYLGKFLDVQAEEVIYAVGSSLLYNSFSTISFLLSGLGKSDGRYH